MSPNSPSVDETDASDAPTDVSTDPPRPTDTDRPDTDATDVQVPADWSWDPTVTCASPEARLGAEMVAVNPGGDWSNQTWPSPGVPLFAGGGVTVADVDADGVFDVFRTSVTGAFRWYAMTAEGAVDHTSRLADLPMVTSSVTVVDVDGDGDLDVHVSGWQSFDRLYRNDEGVFTDVAEALGLAGVATNHTMASSWADADGDGDLDVFIASHGSLGSGMSLPDGDPSRLMLQQDDGTFVDLVPDLPVGHPLRAAHTFQGAWLQLDDDLEPELYVVNDFGTVHPNVAIDVVDGAIETLLGFGFESSGTNMGLGLGDLGRDGREDLVVPEIADIFLYVSGSTGWFEAAEASGMVLASSGAQEVGWGAELADLDNDGDLDALVAFGHLDRAAFVWANGLHQPDAAYIQGPLGFGERAADWGLQQTGVGRGFVVVDLNRDGWLDVVKQDLIGPMTVHQATCGAGAWLGLSLRQPGKNPFGIGATVVVRDGDKRWMRVVRAGGTSFASAGPAEVHFGLGDRTEVEAVEVHWPDGRVDVLEGVALNRWGRATRE